MNKRKIVALAIFALSSTSMHPSAEQKERKQNEAKQEFIGATILGKDKVFLSPDHEKVTFDLTGVVPADSIRIFDAKMIGNKNIIAGIVAKESKKAENRIFIIEFDKDWQSPHVIFNGTTDETFETSPPPSGEAIVKGTEQIKILSSHALYAFGKEFHSVAVIGITQNGHQIAVNVASIPTVPNSTFKTKKTWVSYRYDPFIKSRSDYSKKEGYEEAKISKIINVFFEQEENNEFIANVTFTIDASNVKKNYPTQLTFTDKLFFINRG